MKAAIWLPPACSVSGRDRHVPSFNLLHDQLSHLDAIGIRDVVLIGPEECDIHEEVQQVWPGLWLTWRGYDPLVSPNAMAAFRLLQPEINDNLFWLHGDCWLAREVYVALQQYVGQDMLLVSQSRPTAEMVPVALKFQQVLSVGQTTAGGLDDVYWVGAALLSDRQASRWQALLADDRCDAKDLSNPYRVFNAFAAQAPLTALNIGLQRWYPVPSIHTFTVNDPHTARKSDIPIAPPRLRVLFYAEYSHHLPILLPVYQALRQQADLDLAVAAPLRTARSGPSAAGLEPQQIQRLSRQVRFIEHIGAFQPHVTVTADTGSPPPNGGQNVIISSGLLSDDPNMSLPGIVHQNPKVALICVSGEYHWEKLAGRVPVPIQITGCILSDRLFGRVAVTLDDFCRACGISTRQQMVLYAPAWHPEWSSMAELGLSIADICPEDSVLAILLPGRADDDWQRHYHHLARQDARICLVDEADLLSALAFARVVICDRGPVLEKALSQGVPTILYDRRAGSQSCRPDDPGDALERQLRKMCLMVSAPSQLPEAVATFLANGSLFSEQRKVYRRALNYGRDGKSARRAARAIIQLLNGFWHQAEQQPRRQPATAASTTLPTASAGIPASPVDHPAPNERPYAVPPQPTETPARVPASEVYSSDMDALAHNDQGVQHYQQGNPDQARYHYEQAVKLAPGEVLFQKNLADFYYAVDQRVTDALDLYRAILKNHPDDLETLLTLGHVHAQQGDATQARRYYEKVLALDRRQEEALQALTALGPEARTTESHDLAPSDLDALDHNDRGVQHYQQGNYDQARYHYQQAVKLEPHNILFQKNLADFYYVVEGRVDDAQGIYQAILQEHPEDLETLLTLGHVYAQQGDLEQARRCYQKVLALDNRQEEARQALAAIAADQTFGLPDGQFTEQIEHDQVASLDDSGSNVTPSETAQAAPFEGVGIEITDDYDRYQKALAAGDEQAARQALEVHLEKAPEDALAHNDLAVLLLNADQHATAGLHYELATQLEPHNPVFQKNLADYYYAVAERPLEALAIYDAILADNPADFEALLVKGHILAGQRNWREARKCYEKILEQDSSALEARQSLNLLEEMHLQAEKENPAPEEQSAVCDGQQIDPEDENSKFDIQEAPTPVLDDQGQHEPADEDGFNALDKLPDIDNVTDTGAGADTGLDDPNTAASFDSGTEPDIGTDIHTDIHTGASKKLPPLWLVHHAGGAGAEGVVQALENCGGAPVYHTRLLNPDSLADPPIGTRLHKLLISRFVRRTLDRQPPDKYVLVICLIREPLESQLLCFLEKYTSETNLSAGVGTSIAELQDQFVAQYDFEDLENWLEKEVAQVFEIDLLSRPFDPEEGFCVCNTSRGQLLLLRREDITTRGPQIIESFLGLSNLQISCEGIDIPEKIRPLYDDFRASARWPEDFINQVYASRAVLHFYSAEELKQFKAKWC